jgi:putative nucleotidyltransferase with HDIG domain
MQRGLTSVPEVVRLLGFGRVRDLVLSLSVWDAFVPLDTQARRRLWTHSATVAAAARVLADRVGLDATQAYTAGLLHDIGKLVLGYRVGPSYWDRLRAAESEEALVAAEEREYGCQHATVGGWLLQVWHLPQGLASPVALHHGHFPRSARLEVPQLTAVADRLVEGTDAEGSIAAATLDAVLATAPGVVTRESWRQLYGSIEVEREAMGSLFVGP